MNKRTFTPQQKAAVALAALKGDKTKAEISSMYQVHGTQVHQWKQFAETNFVTLFTDTHQKVMAEQAKLVDELFQIIGQRETELAWLKKKLHISDVPRGS